MSRWKMESRRAALVLLALLATSCAPAVPDMVVGGDGLSAAPGPATTVAGSSSTTAIPSSTTSTTSTTTTTAPTTTVPPQTTTTSLGDAPQGITVGLWTLDSQIRNEAGEQFTAAITLPILTGAVDTALEGRVTSLVAGHIESRVGSTLALWRSIEAEGSRDISGSTLRVDYEVAGFAENFIALRFSSAEQIGDSGGAIRKVSTLMLDLAAGEAVELEDLVLGEDAVEELAQLVRAGLLQDHFAGDAEDFELWAGDLVSGDLNRVALTADGLEVWFDELEVGPPEIGTPVVALPYSALADIIDPEGPAAIFIG